MTLWEASLQELVKAALSQQASLLEPGFRAIGTACPRSASLPPCGRELVFGPVVSPDASVIFGEVQYSGFVEIGFRFSSDCES